MGQRQFIITEDQRKEYASGFLLDLMINGGRKYSVVLEGSDKDLEPLFVHMMTKNYVNLDSDNSYTPTQKGIDKVDNLKQRYEEYLAHFDLFCAVDLELGEYAFEKIFELDDDQWESYINQEQFVDLRIAVAWFKKINPADFVFLSFLKEGRFDTERSNWQFDLLSGLIWEQVEEIVDSAIQIEDLTYTDDEGDVIAGEAVIEDVIRQGAQLSEKLYFEEEHLRCENSEYQNDYYDDDHETQSVVAYRNYYDPYYVSSLWFVF